MQIIGTEPSFRPRLFVSALLSIPVLSENSCGIQTSPADSPPGTGWSCTGAIYYIGDPKPNWGSGSGPGEPGMDPMDLT
jgi:hypothetical protein